MATSGVWEIIVIESINYWCKEDNNRQSTKKYKSYKQCFKMTLLSHNLIANNNIKFLIKQRYRCELVDKMTEQNIKMIVNYMKNPR